MSYDWTPIADALLAQVWPDLGKKCAPMFPGATPKAVANRANKLKIRRNGWKLAERPQKPQPLKAVKVSMLHDDEPLVTAKRDRRTARVCYGFIPNGKVRTVFELASVMGGAR